MPQRSKYEKNQLYYNREQRNSEIIPKAYMTYSNITEKRGSAQFCNNNNIADCLL